MELFPWDHANIRLAWEDDLLMEWSGRIFEQGFDTFFGLSVGKHGCPFVYVQKTKVLIASYVSKSEQG